MFNVMFQLITDAMENNEMCIRDSHQPLKQRLLRMIYSYIIGNLLLRTRGLYKQKINLVSF